MQKEQGGSTIVVLSLLIVCFVFAQQVETLKICAFNIQVFGVTKMSKPEVVDVLIDILLKYDLVLIQEIRDSSEESIYDLLNQVNAQTSSDFAMLLGPRLGSTSSKEQYAYWYRKNQFSLLTSYTYAGSGFERPPLVAHFRTSSGYTFSAIGCHIKPDNAVAELNLMTAVYDDSVSKLNEKESVLMGDFNADCSYVTSSELSTISLYTDSRFNWVISSSVDTTTSSTNCAYDRIVITDSMMSSYGNDAAPFLFDSAYSLNSDLTLDVSDHYPVAFTLSPSFSRSTNFYSLNLLSPLFVFQRWKEMTSLMSSSGSSSSSGSEVNVDDRLFAHREVIGDEWNKRKVDISPSSAHLLGRYPLYHSTLGDDDNNGRSSLDLTLSALLLENDVIPDGRYLLSFDLILIGNWDDASSSYGPDMFSVKFQGEEVLGLTFTKSRELCSFDYVSGDEGICYKPILENTWGYIDRTTREVADLTFRIDDVIVEYTSSSSSSSSSSPNFVFSFGGESLGLYEDMSFESWGMQNIVIDAMIPDVTLPSGLQSSPLSVSFPPSFTSSGDEMVNLTIKVVNIFDIVDVEEFSYYLHNDNSYLMNLIQRALLYQICAATATDIALIEELSSSFVEPSELHVHFRVPNSTFLKLNYYLGSNGNIFDENTFLSQCIIFIN